jgi:hypothetical protein
LAENRFHSRIMAFASGAWRAFGAAALALQKHHPIALELAGDLEDRRRTPLGGAPLPLSPLS